MPCLSSRSSQDKNIEQDNVHVELESVQEQNIDGKDLNMIQELPAKIDSKLNYILKEKKSSPMKSGKWLVSKRSISSLPAPALKPPKNFNNNVDTFEAEYLDDDEECVIELVVPPSVSHPSANAKKKDDVPPTSSSVPESNSSSSSSTTTVHETIGLDDNIEIDIYQDEQRDEDDISVIEIEGSPMNDLDLGGKEVLRKQDDASSNSRSPKKQTVIELDGSPSPALDTSANALPQNDSPPTSKTDPCPVLSPSSPASPYYQTIELDINDVEFESVSDENDDDSDSVIELEVPPKPDPDCLTLSSGDEEEEPENESTNETPTAPQSER